MHAQLAFALLSSFLLAAEAPPAVLQPPADSAWLAPTALTVPARSITMALHEGVLARATFGVTERLQLWGGTSWTVFAGVPLWELGAKLRVVSVGRFHAALVAEHFGFRFDQWTGLLATGGGVVGSFCLDEACASVVSVSGLGGWLYLDGDDVAPETHAGFLVSPSAVVRVARYLKLVVETHVTLPEPDSSLWAALARLPLGALSLDLGAAGDFVVPEVFPAGSISYRW
jgi:hypothetical protein